MEQNDILKIPELIIKIKSRCASEDEINIVNRWRSEIEENEDLYQKLIHNHGLAETIDKYNAIDEIESWKAVESKMDNIQQHKLGYKLRDFLKYAALFVLVSGLSLYFILLKLSDGKNKTLAFSEMQQQISSLSESTLVLANGEIVKLDEQSPLSMQEVDGTRIVKKDSSISYQNINDNADDEKIQYNSLVTPKSKVYTVILSDGTKVWLNSTSAIRYPTYFNKGVRQVFLVGEAYFEVAKDKEHPFIVSTNGMDVTVHGTSFNVMAYPDDRYIETTLVEGSVELTTPESHLMLKPGMQAQLNKNTKVVKEFATDTKRFTCWKEGKYIFDYESLENVMKKLSRWYDVDVTFKNKDSRNLHFTGTLYKYENIDKTLHIIELATDLKFERQENTLEIK